MLLQLGTVNVNASDASTAKAKEAAAKAITKAVVKKTVTRLPVIDLLWPSPIGSNPAYEDPSSKAFKDRTKQ